jgi:RNA polymerase sigma-70 factor (ECF subfamily)
MPSPTDLPPDESRLVELMIAYQGGDRKAFESLYAVLETELRGYFLRGGNERSSVADLLQETFLELHRARRSYLPPRPVRPWVYGVARNVLARSRRTAQRSPVVSAPESFVETPLLATPAADVGEALEHLPPGTREAWILHHLRGVSFRSIAAQLGITVDAAKLRSSRATRALRDFLAGESD